MFFMTAASGHTVPVPADVSLPKEAQKETHCRKVRVRLSRRSGLSNFRGEQDALPVILYLILENTLADPGMTGTGDTGNLFRTVFRLPPVSGRFLQGLNAMHYTVGAITRLPETEGRALL